MTQVQDTTEANDRKIKAWIRFKTKGMNAKQVDQFKHSLDYVHFVCVSHHFREDKCSEELLLLKAYASLRQDRIWDDSLNEALKTHKFGTPEWHAEAVILCNLKKCPAPNQKWEPKTWDEFVTSLQVGEFDTKELTLAMLAKNL